MDSVSELDFDEIIGTDTLTIIDFSATWCMPCRLLAPILEQVADSRTDVNFFNLDIDENEDIAKRYRIFSVPTLMAFKQGKVVDSLVGLNSFDEIMEFVQRCDETEIED